MVRTYYIVLYIAIKLLAYLHFNLRVSLFLSNHLYLFEKLSFSLKDAQIT